MTKTDRKTQGPSNRHTNRQAHSHTDICRSKA